MTHAPKIKGQAGGSLISWLVPWIGAAAAIATVAVGLALDASGTQLGVPHPPFIGAYGPRANVLLVVAIPCFVAAVALVGVLLRARTAVFAAALFVVTLILRVSLNTGRGGTTALDRALFVGPKGEGKNEYLPSLAAFDYGPRFVLDRFAELVPSLPVHSAGHPPGLLLTMHYLGLDTSPKLAAFCVGAGALSAPLTYVLAKRLFDEPIARVAGVLAAFAPSLLHFGATSADAVYLTLGLFAAIPLLSKRPWIGATVLAIVSLFAWSLLAVAAWASILVLARDGLKPALKLAAITGVILLAFHVLFALATGFDPIGTLRATSRVYELGIASRRPYAYWLFGSPTAFLLMLGAPIAWLALKRLGQAAPEALAIAAVIAISCILGFTKAETERIWLFLVPFVILAAAPLVRRPQLVVALLALQAVSYELIFDTLW
jgi:methylthioxylose transferase